MRTLAGRRQSSSPPTRAARAAGWLIAAFFALGGTSATAAAPRVTLHASFRPDRAGASTTLSFGFTVAEPSPVRTIQVELPAGVELATATLGFATCDPEVFQARGAKGCPADSRVGRGSAFAEAPVIGEGNRPEPIYETARVETFFGPIEGNAQIVLFWLEGALPASYWVALIARAVAVPPPYSERLSIEVPLLLAAIEGPYIDLRGFSTTIGPEHITYYLHRHGRATPFTPRGLSVPDRCPRNGAGRARGGVGNGPGRAGGGAAGVGGYPVRATFTWWESSETSHAITRIPCAKRSGKRGRG